MLFKFIELWGKGGMEIESEFPLKVVAHYIKNTYFLELHFGETIVRLDFNKRGTLEEYAGRNNIQEIEYHSSNGKVINKVLHVTEETEKFLRKTYTTYHYSYLKKGNK